MWACGWVLVIDGVRVRRCNFERKCECGYGHG